MSPVTSELPQDPYSRFKRFIKRPIVRSIAGIATALILGSVAWTMWKLDHMQKVNGFHCIPNPPFVTDEKAPHQLFRVIALYLHEDFWEGVEGMGYIGITNLGNPELPYPKVPNASQLGWQQLPKLNPRTVPGEPIVLNGGQAAIYQIPDQIAGIKITAVPGNQICDPGFGVNFVGYSTATGIDSNPSIP